MPMYLEVKCTRFGIIFACCYITFLGLQVPNLLLHNSLIGRAEGQMRDTIIVSAIPEHYLFYDAIR
jgi:hypothetical protein